MSALIGSAGVLADYQEGTENVKSNISKKKNSNFNDTHRKMFIAIYHLLVVMDQ
jgi:hypothetical protein